MPLSYCEPLAPFILSCVPSWAVFECTMCISVWFCLASLCPISALAHNRMVAFLLHDADQMASDPPEFALKQVWFSVLWGSSLHRLFMYVSCSPPECPAIAKAGG